MTNALVITNLTEKINRVENVLPEYFQKVKWVADLAGTGQMLFDLHFEQIMATDSFGVHPDNDFLSCQRSQFSNAKFLYIADEISPKTEMSLRAGGLRFLGSYDHFINSANQTPGWVVDSVKQ